tara:strand:- start:1056 stop:1487 length:432 start_codon:yes stop_codon:yes gene_type:complete
MTFEKEIEEKLKSFRKELVREQNQTNRVEGRASQDRAKKLLGVPDNDLTKSSDEEYWNSPIRFEVKSGKQVADIVKKFELAESQSYDFAISKGIDDKPFSMIAMPHGSGDGLFLCRLSTLNEIVDKLQHMWKTNNEEKENGVD